MAKPKIISTDMIACIADLTGMHQYQVRLVLVSMIQYMMNELALGKTVHFLSLGKFWLKLVPARKGFNPYRRIPADYPEGFVPKFTWGRRAYEFIRCETRKHLLRQPAPTAR